MLILGALSAMTVTWMVAIAILDLAQRLLPANAAIDVPLALALALGVLIVVAPSSVPRFTAPM